MPSEGEPASLFLDPRGHHRSERAAAMPTESAAAPAAEAPERADQSLAAVKKKAKFVTGSLLRHVSVMSFTSSIGMMCLFGVDLVDMVFISSLGNEALAAAVGYAGAILFFTTSISIGLSIATGSLVSRAVGAGDTATVLRLASSVFIFALFLGGVIAFAVWLALRPLVALIGAEGDTLELSVQYLSIVIPSLPLLMVSMSASAILRAHGDAKRAMYATMLTGITNAILDPIFIFGFGWELRGAAIASLFARMTMSGYVLYSLRRHYFLSGFARVPGADVITDVRRIGRVAVPAVLTNLATPIGGAFVTAQMAKYGAEAVAGNAMVSRLQPVAFAVIFSLSGAVGPIIGQNYGAKLYSRVRGAYRSGLIFNAGYVVFATIVLYALHIPLAMLFGAKPGSQAEKLLSLFCGPLALTWVFNGIIFVGNAVCNNLKYPFVATAINWSRHTLGVVPFVYLFSDGMDLGAVGVLVGRETGGGIFALISVGTVMYLTRRLGPDPSSETSSTGGSDDLAHIHSDEPPQGVADVDVADHHDKHHLDMHLSYWGAASAGTVVHHGHQHHSHQGGTHHDHVPAWVATSYEEGSPGRHRSASV